MILYLAGSLPSKLLERLADRAGANHFLFTFADREARKCAEHFCVQSQRRVFVDSGAFSTWSRGTLNDLGEYMKFCKKIMGLAKCPVVFAALDVIAGKKGETVSPTSSEREKACEEGWENFQTMKREGIPCLMTFHQRDHKRWLTRILDESDYLAVAPRKQGADQAEKARWLKQVFDYAGRSKKIHGLGISSPDLIETFPFFSVDSTVWLQGSRAHVRCEGERRPKFKSLDQWKQLARAAGISTRYLRAMLGYGLPGQRPDPEGHSGSYWLTTLAMRSYAEMGYHMTQYWRAKGVVWDDEGVRPWQIYEPAPWWTQTTNRDSGRV